MSALARRFGVGRAHVMRIQREAERNGFIARSPDEEGVSVHPLLAETFSIYFAAIYIIFAVVTHRTIATLGHSAARAAQ